MSSLWMYLLPALGIAAAVAILVFMRKKKIGSVWISVCALGCCLLFAVMGFLTVHQTDSLRKQYDNSIEVRANSILPEMVTCRDLMDNFGPEEPLDKALYILEVTEELEWQWKFLSYEFRYCCEIDTPFMCAHALSQAFACLSGETYKAITNGFENGQELKEYYAGASQELTNIIDYMDSCAQYKKGVIGYDEWSFSSFAQMCDGLLFDSLPYIFREACRRD